MAIKLVNALRNLHIEDNEIEIQKTISFLINNRGYKESQIDATLVIRDYDYIELSEYYGHYEIRPALECMPSCGSPHALDEAYESILNRVIPNREPPQHTRYSAAAKKFMPTEENNEQIENATTNQRSEPLVEESSNKTERADILENNAENTKLYRTDDLSLEICQKKFNHIITTSAKKQRALSEILNKPTHFNHKHFTHEELANELNNLQQRFTFTKTDVDKAYQNINRIKK